VVVKSGAEGSLNAIDMISETDGWIVGSMGTILRWNGKDWINVNSPGTEDFTDVAAPSIDDAWVVGVEFGVFHFNGTEWQQVEVDYQNINAECWYLRSVEVVNADDVWISGSVNPLHWNGSVWKQSYFSLSITNDMGVISADNIWAVGFQEHQSPLAHWNGTEWTISGGEGDLSSIDMQSATDGWAVGWQGFHHWNGSNWQQFYDPQNRIILNSVDMLSSNLGFAVGYNGVIFRWNGD
jgi:photosystem II stability/assembly factor-like uncharacterized protein